MGNTPCTSFNLPAEFVSRLDEQVEALNVNLPMSTNRTALMRMAYYKTVREDSATHGKFRTAIAKLQAGDVQGVPSQIVSVRLLTDMRDGLNALAERYGISVSCVMTLMLEISHQQIGIKEGKTIIGMPVEAWKYRPLRISDNDAARDHRAGS